MFNGEIALTILSQGRINSNGVRVIVVHLKTLKLFPKHLRETSLDKNDPLLQATYYSRCASRKGFRQTNL